MANKQTKKVDPVIKLDKPAKKKQPSFRIGDIGQDIKALQKELGLPETGIYDKATMEAETK